MKINTNLDKGEWVEWEDGVEFLLRPYPISQINTDAAPSELALRIFKYCLVDWKGLIDEKTDKPVRVNDKTKLYFYDHFPELNKFVSDVIKKLMEKGRKESKN